MRNLVIGVAVAATLAAWTGAAFAVPVGAPSAGSIQQDDADRQMDAAAAALRKGDLDKAEGLFREAAKIMPKAPGPWLGLAQVATARGKLDEAGDDLKTAIGFAPDSPIVQVEWARHLILKKDYPNALTALDKAISLEPAAPGPYLLKGDLYQTVLADPVRAEEAYRAAILRAPESGIGHYGLGAVLLAEGKASDAKAELDAAIQGGYQNPLAFLALGRAEMRLGEFPVAATAFESALRLNPKLVAAEIGRGDVLDAQGNTNDALKVYESAIDMDRKSTIALDRHVMLLEKAGRAAGAEKDYRAALAIDPNDLMALNNLAFLLADQKRDLDQALGYAETAVKLSPKTGTFSDTLAWVHRARGDLRAARAILQDVTSKAPTADALYHLGVVDSDLGDKKAAADAFDRALAISPGYAPAKDARAKLAGAD